MNDALEYFQKNPIYRKFHQNNITFSWVYAFSENFMLPLSHDEVVHGKGSLLTKMPGDEWQRFANLRCLYGLMYMHPGTQLLFMGGEFGQYAEWNHEGSLHWHLLEHGYHQGIQQWIKDLNHLFKSKPALNASPFDHASFEHIDFGDYENSVITFLRKLTPKDLDGNEKHKDQLVVCNFTPGFKANYRIGVPQEGEWVEVLNADAKKYGGSGIVNEKVTSDPIPSHGRDHSIDVKLSPLSVMVFECAEARPKMDKKSSKSNKKTKQRK
ncbi:MAG: alpha amylase C-terminal domain-containing protein, partial [Bacteroidota bacterium]